MFFVKLAFKNVRRQYGRTALSMVSIVCGVAVIILGRGFVGGVRENMVRAQIDAVSGHVLVRPVEYPTVGIQHPVDSLLTMTEQDERWLDDNSVAWTRRTFFVGRVVRGPESLRARVIGFDPKTDETVFSRRDWAVVGRISRQGNEVMVSKGIARIFDVDVGDRFVIQARTVDGAINALEVEISAILATGNPSIDRLGLLAPKSLVDRMTLAGDRFSHLAVRLENRGQAERFKAALSARMAGAEVRTWFDEVEGLIEVQKLRQTILDVVAFMLMAIAAAGIANTILMAAYERVREIGTFRAMGLTRQGVVGLFVTEGTVIGSAGAALGMLLGGGIVYKYAEDGIDLSGFVEGVGSSGSYDSIPLSMTLYLEYDSWTLAMAACFGLLVAALASVYPAFVASRMPPAEAVRA